METEAQSDDVIEVRYFFKTDQGFMPMWAYGGVLMYVGWDIDEDGPVMERTLH